jgi:4-amino-4-deoxy-L-arabinose transferase-like glycosyltransferase
MKKLILILIIILAATLRLWDIGQVPASLDWDEVALGYNAYSIMLTGKDEYGKTFPVVLESFGDFKPALYAYLIIPFLPIFGLTEIAVRLPSVLFGIIAVLLTYFLTKKLLKRTDLALTAAFLLAISPWHIQFSRVAFEANVAMTLNLAAILFFLKGLKKPIFFNFTAVFFSLSLYTYQSEKLFVPLILLILIGVFFGQLKKLPKKNIIIPVLLLIIFSLPITLFTLTNQNGLARAKGVSFLSDTNSLLERNAKINLLNHERGDYIGLLFDNRRVVYIKTYIQGYLSHFDLNWLFITGDSTNRHHAPQMGLMYLIELPFLLIGFYFLIFKNSLIPIDKKTKIFLLLWILATPIPAAFTTGVPHAVRTLNALPSLQIITALGLIIAIIKISNIKYQILKIKLKILILTLCFLLFIFNFSFFINQYFVQQNYFYADQWNYGYRQLTDYLKPIRTKYKKVIVSTQGYLDQSYIFFLFYNKYDPQKYLAEGGTQISGIQKSGNKFLNYKFGKFDDYNEKNLTVLYVGTEKDLRNAKYKTIKRINFPDGTQALYIVKNYEKK